MFSTKLFKLGALVSLLVGLIGAPHAAASDEGKGVVAVAYDGKPQRVLPVVILDVDGKPQPLPRRDTLFLEPGSHELRLSPVIDDSAGLRRGALSPKASSKVFTIEVAAGTRYLIGASFDGADADSWRPVVHRTEQRRSAQP